MRFKKKKKWGGGGGGGGGGGVYPLFRPRENSLTVKNVEDELSCKRVHFSPFN